MVTHGLCDLFFVFNIFRGACLLVILLNRCKNLLRLSFGSEELKTEVHVSFHKIVQKGLSLKFSETSIFNCVRKRLVFRVLI